MAAFPEPLQRLISGLNKLPGIGPKSAERLALHIVQTDGAFVRELSASLLDAREKVQACQNCGSLTEKQPCSICGDDRRDASTICVVERATDILSLEKSGSYRGRFHVLGGRISPLNGVGPEDLRIAELERRLETEPVTEVILALPSDVEGEATCHYLAKLFGGGKVKVSRIAQGMPVGGGLEYADELTLNRAMEGRREFI